MDFPKINKKGAITTEQVTFKDLPDKEVIMNAIKIFNTIMSAMILFMASGDCTKRNIKPNIELFLMLSWHGLGYMGMLFSVNSSKAN